MAEKPSVLIVGGLGYIGRWLALHIQQNGLASEVRIVDKVCHKVARFVGWRLTMACRCCPS